MDEFAPDGILAPVARVTVLWSHLSGYLDACLRELHGRGVQLQVSWFRSDAKMAPFAADKFTWIGEQGESLAWADSQNVDGHALASRIEQFDPQIALISGWNHGAYRYVARRLRGHCKRILAMDNPWDETAKQWLGRIIAPWYIRPLYDGAFVAGERQFQFARRLGFRDGEIATGVFAPDSVAFSKISEDGLDARRAFIYLGRLSAEKGVQTLKIAYDIYRRLMPHPWPLSVAGTGPLAKVLEGAEGIQMLGFVQPHMIPDVLSRHSCLVAPSDWDHWGLQISEAASAGLAIIATTACGASVHLVREGFNGHLVPPKDSLALARAMCRIHTREHLVDYGRHSRQLGEQFTPTIWADNLLAHPSVAQTGSQVGRFTRTLRTSA